MYNKLLDTLFNCWLDELDEESRNKFCMDGLMYKYGHPEPDVDKQWEMAKRRVMFLLKDNPDGEKQDTRTWLIDEKNGESVRNLSGGRVGKTGFLPNIARMLYGFLKTDINSDYLPNFETVSVAKNEVKDVFNTAPFAFVEAKKNAGKSTVSSKEINAALNRDEIFLKKEIDILRPNIIVCCDADDEVFKFVTERYFLNAEPEKIEYKFGIWNGEKEVIEKGMKPCCLWYYPEHNVVVVKSYHPTRLGKGVWMVYERVISPFRKFLREHPNF